MKYLALISAFNSTEVITVGLFNDYDTALEEAKKAHERYYTIARHYVIPMEEDKSIYLSLHDHNREYQQYCDKCGGTEELRNRDGEILCGDCSFKKHLEWCRSKEVEI